VRESDKEREKETESEREKDKDSPTRAVEESNLSASFTSVFVADEGGSATATKGAAFFGRGEVHAQSARTPLAASAPPLAHLPDCVFASGVLAVVVDFASADSNMAFRRDTLGASSALSSLALSLQSLSL